MFISEFGSEKFSVAVLYHLYLQFVEVGCKDLSLALVFTCLEVVGVGGVRGWSVYMKALCNFLYTAGIMKEFWQEFGCFNLQI